MEQGIQTERCLRGPDVGHQRERRIIVEATVSEVVRQVRELIALK